MPMHLCPESDIRCMKLVMKRDFFLGVVRYVGFIGDGGTSAELNGVSIDVKFNCRT